MKTCPSCGAQIADDSRFCTECGKECTQGDVCPHCGALVNDGDSFCQNCGKSIMESKSESAIDEPIFNEEEKKSGFKKYLPYIIGAFVLLMIIGYYSSNESDNDSSNGSVEAQVMESSNTEEKKKLENGADYTEEDIKNSIEAMYEDIFNATTSFDFDKRYTSSEYQALDAKAAKVADGDLYIDSDHWIQGQDCDKPSMSVFSVKKESDNKAVAKVHIKQFQDNDDTTLLKLIMLFENGKWVVDDFITIEDGGEEYSEKSYLKDFIKEAQSKPKEDYSWLQGHWVYEQGNYKGHFIIQGNTITQYSSMNPKHYDATFRIEGNELRAKLVDGMDLVVKIDFANHTIDYGDGNWMHKIN